MIAKPGDASKRFARRGIEKRLRRAKARESKKPKPKPIAVVAQVVGLVVLALGLGGCQSAPAAPAVVLSDTCPSPGWGVADEVDRMQTDGTAPQTVDWIARLLVFCDSIEPPGGGDDGQ